LRSVSATKDSLRLGGRGKKGNIISKVIKKPPGFWKGVKKKKQKGHAKWGGKSF